MPAGPIARLVPGCRQNVLRHARSILYFSKDCRSQPVDATLACSLFAGVSKPKVFRGR